MAIPPLDKLAWKAEDENVRFMATKALGEPGPEAISSLEKLASEVEDADVLLDGVRLMVAMGLVKLGPEAIPALEKLAWEAESEWVRRAAAEALGGLDPKKAIPPLEKLAWEAKDGLVRRAAARALGGLGAPPLGCESLD